MKCFVLVEYQNGARSFSVADKKKFLVFCGPRKKFIILLKIFCHMFLSWATLIYYTLFYSICWISSLILSFYQFISIPSVLSCKFFPYMHVRTSLSSVRFLVSLLCLSTKVCPYLTQAPGFQIQLTASGRTAAHPVAQSQSKPPG
jgi:hypothetical protein